MKHKPFIKLNITQQYYYHFYMNKKADTVLVIMSVPHIVLIKLSITVWSNIKNFGGVEIICKQVLTYKHGTSILS